jgi:hypothetical protein
VQHRVIITGAKERLETPQLIKEGYLCYLEEFIYFYLLNLSIGQSVLSRGILMVS